MMILSDGSAVLSSLSKRRVLRHLFQIRPHLKKQADMFVQVDINGGGFRRLDLL
jgi:hypothetical protein